jgi:GAF domain-containing protein
MERATPGVPIVVLSGLHDEAMAIRAVREGAQDYLVKGQVEPESIGRAIHHAIERHQLQVDLMQQAAALRESESMFRRVIEASADGIVILDVNDTVRLANTAAAELFGSSPEDLTGLPFGLPIVAGRLVERALPTGRSVELRSGATEWLGTPAKLVSLRETTERRRRLDQQQALSSLAQLAFKHAPEELRAVALKLIAKTLGVEACVVVPAGSREAAASPLSVPIHGDEAPLGLLAVVAPEGRAFSDDDRHFLEGAARVLGETARRERAAEQQAALEAQIRHAQ